LQFRERLLVVQTPEILGRNIPRSYTGELIPMSDQFQREVMNDVLREFPDLEGFFVPFMMKEHDYRTNGTIGLVAGGVVMVLWIIGLIYFLRQAIDPTKHRTLKNLAKFGDLERVVPHIENEINNGLILQQGKMCLTNSWVARVTGTSLHAALYKDVIWCYKKVTQRRVNGIPAGKSFAIAFHTRYGDQFLVDGKDTQLDPLMEEVAKRAPWTIFGYTEEIKKAWDKERQALIQAVDARREELRHQRQQPQQPEDAQPTP